MITLCVTNVLYIHVIRYIIKSLVCCNIEMCIVFNRCVDKLLLSCHSGHSLCVSLGNFQPKFVYWYPKLLPFCVSHGLLTSYPVTVIVLVVVLFWIRSLYDVSMSLSCVCFRSESKIFTFTFLFVFFRRSYSFCKKPSQMCNIPWQTKLVAERIVASLKLNTSCTFKQSYRVAYGGKWTWFMSMLWQCTLYT